MAIGLNGSSNTPQGWVGVLVFIEVVGEACP